MCGELPNEGLDSSVEVLTQQGIKMAKQYAKQGLIDPLEGL